MIRKMVMMGTKKNLGITRNGVFWFMRLLESAPDSMIIADSEGKILMVNKQTENLFGFDRQEIIGKQVEILIPEKYHLKHVQDRKGYAANPKTRPMGAGLDLFGKRKDGSEFPVEISLSPLKIEEENLMIIAAIRDITQQKDAQIRIKHLNDNLERLVIERTGELEKALKNEKSARTEMTSNQIRLEFLKDAGDVLSSTLDYCEILVRLSKTVTPKIADWCTIYEYLEDNSLNMLVVSHADPKKSRQANALIRKFPHNPDLSSKLYKAVLTGEPELYQNVSDEFMAEIAWNHEHLRLLREMGIKSAMLIPMFIREKFFGLLFLVTTGTDRCYDNRDLEFAQEIARRAMLAIENARLYEEAQKAKALLEHRVALRTRELEAINKELEAFSYSVSHDLRAPLRSIDGFSNKILKDYIGVLDEQAQDYFRRIKRASQHMGQLIDDLLKLSRLSRIEIRPENTDLSALADSIIAELKNSDPERKAEVRIEPGMVVKADKNLIQIALQNMIDNAWKYSKNQPVSMIEFYSVHKDHHDIYCIRDNGVGFDMKYADKLFKSFQRLHSNTEFEGTGIGLATVQRIIQRHQGTIWVESEENMGTTFYFTI